MRPIQENFEHQRARIYQSADSRFAIDAGANPGQWFRSTRKILPNACIHSYEPDVRAFDKLTLVHAESTDANWYVCNTALGNADEAQELYESPVHSGMSSLLPFNPDSDLADHLLSGHYAPPIQTVKVSRLDSIYSPSDIPQQGSILKADVQGFELEVLEGAGALLSRFEFLEVETGLRDVYSKSRSGLSQVLNFCEKAGFAPVVIHTPRWNPSLEHTFGAALDCDLILRRVQG